MSSSSLYEEDEEGSDSDIESRYSNEKFSASSPPIDDFLGADPAEPDGNITPEVIPRASRGTRAEIRNTLYTSLGVECVDAYTDVFSETADLTEHAGIGNGYHNITQNGVVTWTPQEKETFFNVLDRKSKDGIAEIARAIGSKSELEVQDHLKLLHRGLQRQHLRDRHSRTIVLGDVPAALEISQQCCKALDDYAELLSLEEQQAEDVTGRKVHHEVWIVDRDVAEMVDEQLEAQDETPLPGSSVYVTAELFSMDKWIRLSERFFMNSGGPRLEDNWVNIACAGETPSITADAFADFYALAISVTRRLVHSALFFATSRLRNMRETGNRKARIVRSRDVRTALNVLNMPQDRFDFWVGLARRCSLQVADLRHKKGWQSELMDYNEVEDILSEKAPVNGLSDKRSASRRGYEGRASRGDADDGQATDDDVSESDVSSSVSSLLSSPEMTPVEEWDEDPEADHAEKIDQKNNASEELRLWKLMGQPVPPYIKSLNSKKERESKLRKPTGERKTKEDLVDWRDRTLYRSDWEEYGHEIHDLYEELSENRRKRRRLESYTTIQQSSLSTGSERDRQMGDLDIQQRLDQDTIKNEQNAGNGQYDCGREMQIEDGNDAMDIDDSGDNESDSEASEDTKMNIETSSIDQSPDPILKHENVESSSDDKSMSEDESDSSDDDQKHQVSSPSRPQAEAALFRQETPEAVVKREASGVDQSEESESGYDSDSDTSEEDRSDQKHSPSQLRSGGVSVTRDAESTIKEEGSVFSHGKHSESESSSVSDLESDEDSDSDHKPEFPPQDGIGNGGVPLHHDPRPVIKEETIESSESGESESEETGSEVESSDIDHKPHLNQTPQTQTRIKSEFQHDTRSDPYPDSNGSDTDSDSRHGIKLEPHDEGSDSESDMVYKQSTSGSEADSEADSSEDDRKGTVEGPRQLYESSKVEPKVESDDELSSVSFERRQKREDWDSSSD